MNILSDSLEARIPCVVALKFVHRGIKRRPHKMHGHTAALANCTFGLRLQKHAYPRGADGNISCRLNALGFICPSENELCMISHLSKQTISAFDVFHLVVKSHKGSRIN